LTNIIKKRSPSSRPTEYGFPVAHSCRQLCCSSLEAHHIFQIWMERYRWAIAYRAPHRYPIW